VTIWAESINDLGGKKIQSPKYTFQVNVLEKEAVNNTTSSPVAVKTAYMETANTTTPKNTMVLQTTTNIQLKKTPSNVKFVLIAAVIITLVVLLIIMSR
jgi:hypothetical protein